MAEQRVLEGPSIVEAEAHQALHLVLNRLLDGHLEVADQNAGGLVQAVSRQEIGQALDLQALDDNLPHLGPNRPLQLVPHRLAIRCRQHPCIASQPDVYGTQLHEGALDVGEQSVLLKQTPPGPGSTEVVNERQRGLRLSAEPLPQHARRRFGAVSDGEVALGVGKQAQDAGMLSAKAADILADVG